MILHGLLKLDNAHGEEEKEKKREREGERKRRRKKIEAKQSTFFRLKLEKNAFEIAHRNVERTKHTFDTGQISFEFLPFRNISTACRLLHKPSENTFVFDFGLVTFLKYSSESVISGSVAEDEGSSERNCLFFFY